MKLSRTLLSVISLAGLATAACQCDKVSKEGLYCGYCDQVLSVKGRGDANAYHVFWCNKSGGCEDLGRSTSHCEKDPQNTNVNCAGYETWPPDSASSSKSPTVKPSPSSASKPPSSASSKPTATPSSKPPTATPSQPPVTSTPKPPASSQPSASSSVPPRTSGVPDDKCAPMKEYNLIYKIPRDNRNEFLESEVIRSLSESAFTPSDYSAIFKNQHGSILNDDFQLLGEDTLSLYDVDECANNCSNIPGCQSFNIYFQRLPIYVPDAQWCPNPKATVRISCQYWDGKVDGNMAGNVGGPWLNTSFYVAIAGSNAYQRYAPARTVSDMPSPTARGSPKPSSQ